MFPFPAAGCLDLADPEVLCFDVLCPGLRHPCLRTERSKVCFSLSCPSVSVFVVRFVFLPHCAEVLVLVCLLFVSRLCRLQCVE